MTRTTTWTEEERFTHIMFPVFPSTACCAITSPAPNKTALIHCVIINIGRLSRLALQKVGYQKIMFMIIRKWLRRKHKMGHCRRQSSAPFGEIQPNTNDHTWEVVSKFKRRFTLWYSPVSAVSRSHLLTQEGVAASSATETRSIRQSAAGYWPCFARTPLWIP